MAKQDNPQRQPEPSDLLADVNRNRGSGSSRNNREPRGNSNRPPQSDRNPRRDQPPESAADRIERIAREAEEQRTHFYDKCLADYHDAEGAIALIKSKSPREQNILREQLVIEQKRSDEALYHITDIEFEDLLPIIDERIAELNGIADANQTAEEQDLFTKLIEQKAYIEERAKRFNIGQPKKEVKTAPPEKVTQPPARPPEPIIGSQEWKARIAELAAAAKLKRDAILAERAGLLALEPEFLAHRDIQTRLQALDKELADVMTYIPPDKQTAKTVIIEKTPAAPAKETRQLVYTPEELAQQADDEDIADEMAEVERAKKDITRIDGRIAAQDKRTLAGREKIAELEAARLEAASFIAKYEPEPPNIRPEVNEQINKLDTICSKSQNLYDKSLKFMGDKAQAAAAIAQIERLNEHIKEDYTKIYIAIKKELNQLTDIQRQEIPPLPENVDEGTRGLAAWFDKWQDSEAGSGEIARRDLPFYKRAFARPNKQALANLLAIAQSPELADVLNDQATRENHRLAWERDVTEQQEYIDTCSKDVMEVIENGLPELPNNITDDERTALIPYLSQIIANTEVTKISNKVDAKTLKRWSEFDKTARKQLDILYGRVKQEASTATQKPETRPLLRRPGEMQQVDVEEYGLPPKIETQRDPTIHIDWSNPKEQATLMQYRDNCKKGTATWAAAELLRVKQGFTNRSYFMKRTKGFSADELEDAWDDLEDAMAT